MPSFVKFIGACAAIFDENMEIKLISTMLHLLCQQTVCTTNYTDFVNVTIFEYL